MSPDRSEANLPLGHEHAEQGAPPVAPGIRWPRHVARICLVLLLAACAALLPRSEVQTEGSRASFEEAQKVFDQSIPHQTTVEDLKNGVLLISGNTVVYKLTGGQSNIHEHEHSRNPLGPFQGIGESRLLNR